MSPEVCPFEAQESKRNKRSIEVENEEEQKKLRGGTPNVVYFALR